MLVLSITMRGLTCSRSSSSSTRLRTPLPGSRNKSGSVRTSAMPAASILTSLPFPAPLPSLPPPLFCPSPEYRIPSGISKCIPQSATVLSHPIILPISNSEFVGASISPKSRLFFNSLSSTWLEFCMTVYTGTSGCSRPNPPSSPGNRPMPKDMFAPMRTRATASMSRNTFLASSACARMASP